MTQKHIRTFYTDGSCQGNPGLGGWGFVELNNVEKTLVGYDYQNNIENTTNNRMELEAILAVCELIGRDIVYDSTDYIIYSDSAYCVNLINKWMWNWAKHNWYNSKKEEIANKDLILKLYDHFSRPFYRVEIKKIPGHSNNFGNELADRLATGKINEVEKLLENSNYNIDTTSTGFMRSLFLKSEKFREIKHI